MTKKLVVIPTYNESENIADIISDILKLNLDILIVDDNSPDNTSKIVMEHKEFDSKVFLLSRKEKLGLGSAYREGFQKGINMKYEYFIQMDADFSHRVEDLKLMINQTENKDVIIGQHREVNILIEPYNFPKPIFFFNDYAKNKFIYIYDISKIK